MHTHMKTRLLAACALAAIPARAHADLNFDATTVTPDTGIGDPLPSGWYNVAIDESEMKPTKDGAGSYLQTRFNVLDGQYAGRKLFHMFNMKNANQQTVEIAQKQLSALCHAVNVLKPAKSEQLHSIPLKIKVAIKAASGDYEAGNKITSFKPASAEVDMAGGDSAGAAAFGAGAPVTQSLDAPPSQPWTAPATATLATEQAPAAVAQPWAAPAAETAPAAAPAAPAAPEAPAAPAAVVEHDPIKAAEADGWILHPSNPQYHYKGTEVVESAKLIEKYPAPAAPLAPAAPAAPAVPTAPTAPATAGSTETQTSAPAADAAAAQTAPPPWAAAKA